MPDEVAGTAAAPRLRGPRARNLSTTLVPPSSFTLSDPINDPRWGTLVDTAPGGSVFHHPAWISLLGCQYRYPLVACCVLGPDGAFEAGMPLALVGGRVNRARLVGLPFSDACAPLARDGLPSQFRRLAIALDQLRRRTGLEIELRGDLEGARPLETFHQHVLALEDGYDEVVRGMKSQVGRGQRRARREGLAVEFGRDAAALADFYRLHLRTRRHQGLPTQPRRFIIRFKDLFARGLGFVVIVRDGPRPVAAAVFLTYRGTLMYKFGASSREALPKRPNNLLFGEAIRWACEHGFQEVDFGRTATSHESLTAFKRSFGAREQRLTYTVMSDAPPERRERGRGVAASLIRRSPVVVSRVAGELLYRDFAP